MKKLLAIILALMTLTSTACAETLRLYRISPTFDSGSVIFTENHPDVQLVRSEDDYQETKDMVSQMVLREFHNDAFKMSNSIIDFRQIMEKGYCLDLSSNEQICALISRMHPYIAEQVMLDDQILGIPYNISFSYVTVDSGWTEAGYTAQDIPRTYPQLLDFLQEWVQSDQDDYGRITVINTWDESLYGPDNYTAWLVEQFLGTYLLQLQFSGAPVRFNDPELIELLQRTKDIGEALYQKERVPNGKFQLLTSYYGWPQSLDEDVVCFNMSDDQPILIDADFDILSAYAATEHPELAMELLESILANLEERSSAFFYLDAQPVMSAFTASEMPRVIEDIATLEEQLGSETLDIDEKDRLELSLENARIYLDYLAMNEYEISPQQLADYHHHIDQIAIIRSTPFSRNTSMGWNFFQLENRFAQGQMTAAELVHELDRLAQMVAMENQ